jgi:hypothetical protein
MAAKSKLPEQQAAADLAKRRGEEITRLMKQIAAMKATVRQYANTRRTNANPFGSRYR